LKDDIINCIIQQQGQHLPRNFNENRVNIEIDIFEAIRNNYQSPNSISLRINSIGHRLRIFSH
jgi:hypothetical protein